MKLSHIELGAVARFIRGITFKPVDVVTRPANGEVACMRTSNVQANLDTTDVWHIPATFVKRAEQYLQAGDVLVSSANSWNLVGKCCWVPDLSGSTTFGGFVSVLRADPTKLDPRYMYWWFSSPRVQQLVRSFGRKTTNISNLDLTRCLHLHIPFPPLDEQRRIARALDAAQHVRAARVLSLKHFDALVESYFIAFFGDPDTNPLDWEIKRVSDFVSTFEGGRSFAGTDDEDSESAYRVLRISAVTSGRFLPEESRPVPHGYVPPARHVVRPGDLLISRANTSELVGAVALVDDVEGQLLLPDKIWRFVWRDDEAAVPEFVWQLFRTRSVRTAISRRSTGTSGSMKNISAAKLAGIEVIQPPVDRQREFARLFRHVWKLRAHATGHLVELDTLFASLQQRAFNAEL